eukprot:10722872-Alexandrium_andersonii.AAC.1
MPHAAFSDFRWAGSRHLVHEECWKLSAQAPAVPATDGGGSALGWTACLLFGGCWFCALSMTATSKLVAPAFRLDWARGA